MQPPGTEPGASEAFQKQAAVSLPVPGSDDIRITVATRAALMQTVAERIEAGHGFALATLNLDHLVKLRADPAFASAYAAHELVVADGNPVVWLSRLAGRPVELIPGSELIDPLCAWAAQNNVPVAFLGSTDETLASAAKALGARYPGLDIVAQIAPAHGLDPQGSTAAEALGGISAAGARLCFLALGAPKQEIMAARGREIAPACGFVSIGAGLDFIAGTQTRAPGWVRAIALEWLWRMLSNPRRLAARYIACAILLPSLVLRTLRRRVQG